MVRFSIEFSAGDVYDVHITNWPTANSGIVNLPAEKSLIVYLSPFFRQSNIAFLRSKAILNLVSPLTRSSDMRVNVYATGSFVV